MVDSPSKRVVGDANAGGSVEDALGRQLTLRFPTSFLRMRLARYIGSELQKNEEWWGNSIIALSVSAIDGTPVPEARNAEQIEATILKLDDAGMIAVGGWLKEEADRRAEAVAADAKN